MRVCVVGLGTVGRPVARYCLDKGLEVYGYDVDPEAVDRAGFVKASSRWDEIPPSDVYLICVSTGFSSGNPDMSPIFDVCRKIAEHSPELVSIESTITPGVSRKVFNEVFKRRVRLIHVPHRYWTLNPVEHGVKQLRVIGAMDIASLRSGVEFYTDVLGVLLHTVTPIEVAEMTKIAENAYRYVEIAFAEELRMACEELELSPQKVREACNTKWNVKILEARGGIGGSCLPKDTRYLVSITSHDRLLKAAMTVDEDYREWLRRA